VKARVLLLIVWYGLLFAMILSFRLAA